MKMKGMNLTKVQVAHRQLGTGLKLFLSNHDPVSVHALACAGGGIAEHLTRKRGEQPFSSHALATSLISMRRKSGVSAISFGTPSGTPVHKKARNGTTGSYSNVSTICKTTTRSLSGGTQVFQIWYFALYPEKLNRDFDKTPIEETFSKLQDSHARNRNKHCGM
jgi:hypothetical protein